MTLPRLSARSWVSVGLSAALAATAVAGTSTAMADQNVTATTRCRTMTTSVHRSINPRTTATLLTVWSSEAINAKLLNGFTAAVSTPFNVSATRRPGLVAVHRLYNASTHDFLWTKSGAEVSSATAKYGYTDQGVVFYASASGGACLKPVYRYQKSGIRRYATTAEQRNSLARSGWRYESIGFYAARSTSAANSGAKPAARPKPPAPKHTGKPAPSKPKQTKPPSTGPLNQKLYLARSTSAWHAYSRSSGQTKTLLYQIAGTPTATWLGGRSTDRDKVDKIMNDAAAAHRTPTFVLYAIPHRDCGNYSAGGLRSVSQYKSWVDSVRRGIAGRKAVVIVEPDAVGMSCLSASQRSNRLAMLRYAMSRLSSKKTWAYIHAGSSGLSAKDVAAVLKHAGVASARGFAVNVSSFDSTANEVSYGKAIMKALKMKKHFVIDTSRNGAGRYVGSAAGAPGWCNPPGRALGKRPTTKTASAQVDAYLWIKPPGESDGQCHPGDPAGWYQSYAIGLVQQALRKKTIAPMAVP